MRWRSVCALFASLLVLGVACGGRSVRHSEGDAGEGAEGPTQTGGTGTGTGGTGTGGTGTGGTGTGGTGTGGTGTAGSYPIHPPRYCSRGDEIYAIGAVVEEPRFCERCVCANDGILVCSRCNATCRVLGSELPVGESAQMPDGCTTCLCTVDGVDCNSSACVVPDPCRDLATEYEVTVGAERWCDRAYTCVDAVSVAETIPCGCKVAVRHSEAIFGIADAYYAMGCPVPPVCDKSCAEPRFPFRCGEAGFCIGGI